MGASLKYRADIADKNEDGSKSWFAVWFGGKSLAKIENCRWFLVGDPRVTAYITGEPDTYFSVPAAINYKGLKIKGYITYDQHGPIFHHNLF